MRYRYHIHKIYISYIKYITYNIYDMYIYVYLHLYTHTNPYFIVEETGSKELRTIPI